MIIKNLVKAKQFFNFEVGMFIGIEKLRQQRQNTSDHQPNDQQTNIGGLIKPAFGRWIFMRWVWLIFVYVHHLFCYLRNGQQDLVQIISKKEQDDRSSGSAAQGNNAHRWGFLEF